MSDPVKEKGTATLQLYHASHPLTPPITPRRIPRGKTGNTDPVNLLRRMAERNNGRIRGMICKTLPGWQRKKLQALRRRLVELVALMTERPWETPVGAHEEITGTMAEARQIYAKAPKPDGSRRAKRPPEQKGVRAKNRVEQDGPEAEDRPDEENDPIEEIIRRAREPRSDPRADAFWAAQAAAANK